MSAINAPDRVFIHKLAICESALIGADTKIWAFAHILPDARVGRDCNICDGVFIENDVTIGDRVTVKNGVQLWDGVRLMDDVFVGPNATFANDPYPRSKVRPHERLRTIVRRGASIGANATILPGVIIGERAMIGAGAVIVHDVPALAIVVGNPGRIIGYVDADRSQRAEVEPGTTEGRVQDTLRVAGCRLLPFPTFGDLRGNVTIAEFAQHLPFTPVRLFFVHGVPSDRVRGEHAHRQCSQVLLAINGSMSVVLDDGKVREEVSLRNPDIGVLVPPNVWTELYRFTADAVLAVFASSKYDPDDYIRAYDEFLTHVGAGPKGSES